MFDTRSGSVPWRALLLCIRFLFVDLQRLIVLRSLYDEHKCTFILMNYNVTDESWPCGYTVVGGGVALDCTARGLIRAPSTWINSLIIGSTLPPVHGDMFSYLLRIKMIHTYTYTHVTHVPWYMTGSLISGFLINRWRGKRSRHSRCMRNPQYYVSGKR